MPKKLKLTDLSLKNTRQIGNMIGKMLKVSDTVLLNGTLGAGKTTLTKAISKGLGIKSDHYVVSPSYAIINEYLADLKIYHFDLYRIESPDEFFELGAYEYLQGDGVCIIEWADKFVDAMPKENLSILLEETKAGQNKRNMTLLATSKRYEAIIKSLKDEKENLS
ncbi:tRNA (adenosine(37)-N6)-threonylcarbamoyltransferase complex ATPase subunit type 1 TsaE [Thermodesulfobacteriota bacterium]